MAEDAAVVGHIAPVEDEELLAEGLELLDPAERARLEQLIHEERQVQSGDRRRPLSLREFVDRISGGKFQWYRYALVLAGVLQRVADGLLSRVMVFAPPRHGKSELVSKYFPAYYLYRHPDRWVALTSYGASLAKKLAKAARAVYFKARSLPERGAVTEWETGLGGGLWSTGVDGPALGKGYHLGIIDDPVKDAHDASSEPAREANKEWYRSVFSTRAEPGAAIVVIQQRWHEDDLSGWLLEEEWAEAQSGDAGSPERWHIVNFEAIKSSAEEIAADVAQSNRPSLYPPTCTIEPDWRKPGEALCPERYPLKELLRRMRRTGAYYWAALFQQRPRARAGLSFKIDRLRVVKHEDVPWHRLVLVRCWDKAGSEDSDADFTVGALVGLDPVTLLYFILDLERGQWEPGARDLKIEAATKRDVQRFGTERYVVWGAQDPGVAGKDSARQFRQMVKDVAEGLKCFTEPESGSKEDRADGLTSAVNQGEVRLLDAAWNAVLRRELADFPKGSHDDIVDACARAYNKLTRKAPRERDDTPQSVSTRFGVPMGTAA